MSKTIKIGDVALSRPIKAYSHRGFVLGWCAITVVGVMAFGLLAVPLGHSRAEIEPTRTGMISASFN